MEQFEKLNPSVATLCRHSSDANRHSRPSSPTAFKISRATLRFDDADTEWQFLKHHWMSQRLTTTLWLLVAFTAVCFASLTPMTSTSVWVILVCLAFVIPVMAISVFSSEEWAARGGGLATTFATAVIVTVGVFFPAYARDDATDWHWSGTRDEVRSGVPTFAICALVLPVAVTALRFVESFPILVWAAVLVVSTNIYRFSTWGIHFTQRGIAVSIIELVVATVVALLANEREILRRRTFQAKVQEDALLSAAAAGVNELTAQVSRLLPPMLHSKLVSGAYVDRSADATLVFIEIDDFASWFPSQLPKVAAGAITTCSVEMTFESTANVGVESLHAYGDMYTYCSNLFSRCEPHAMRSLRFALGVQTRRGLSWHADGLHLRIAVATGPLVGAKLGAGFARYDVFGPLVAQTHAMLHDCPTDCVVTSNGTITACERSEVFCRIRELPSSNLRQSFASLNGSRVSSPKAGKPSPLALRTNCVIVEGLTMNKEAASPLRPADAMPAGGMEDSGSKEMPGVMMGAAKESPRAAAVALAAAAEEEAEAAAATGVAKVRRSLHGGSSENFSNPLDALGTHVAYLTDELSSAVAALRATSESHSFQKPLGTWFPVVIPTFACGESESKFHMEALQQSGPLRSKASMMIALFQCILLAVELSGPSEPRVGAIVCFVLGTVTAASTPFLACLDKQSAPPLIALGSEGGGSGGGDGDGRGGGEANARSEVVLVARPPAAALASACGSMASSAAGGGAGLGVGASGGATPTRTPLAGASPATASNVSLPQAISAPSTPSAAGPSGEGFPTAEFSSGQLSAHSVGGNPLISRHDAATPPTTSVDPANGSSPRTSQAITSRRSSRTAVVIPPPEVSEPPPMVALFSPLQCAVLALSHILLWVGVALTFHVTIYASPLYAAAFLGVVFAWTSASTTPRFGVSFLWYSLLIGAPFFINLFAVRPETISVGSTVICVAATGLLFAIGTQNHLERRAIFRSGALFRPTLKVLQAQRRACEHVINAFPAQIRQLAAANPVPGQEGHRLHYVFLPDTAVCCLRADELLHFFSLPNGVALAAEKLSIVDLAVRKYCVVAVVVKTIGDLTVIAGPLAEPRGEAALQEACMDVLSVVLWLRQKGLALSAAISIDSVFAIIGNVSHPSLNLVGRGAMTPHMIVSAAPAGAIVATELFVIQHTDLCKTISAMPASPKARRARERKWHPDALTPLFGECKSWRIRSLGTARVHAVRSMPQGESIADIFAWRRNSDVHSQVGSGRNSPVGGESSSVSPANPSFASALNGAPALLGRRLEAASIGSRHQSPTGGNLLFPDRDQPPRLSPSTSQVQLLASHLGEGDAAASASGQPEPMRFEDTAAHEEG